MSRMNSIISRLTGAFASLSARPTKSPDATFTALFNGLEIRAANRADVPAVLPMVQKTSALHQQWDPAKFELVDDFIRRYRRWLIKLIDDPRSIFLVAEKDDHLIAFLVAFVDRPVPLYRLAEFGYIRDMWVENDYRRIGVGRKMIHAAIEQFTAMGIRQVRLATAAANEPARAFFAACGFRPSATEMLIAL